MVICRGLGLDRSGVISSIKVPAGDLMEKGAG